MDTLFRSVGVLALGLALSACGGMKQIVVLEDNDMNWKRSVEGSFVVYRISMSGEPPYTEIIVPDEAAASAFRSLVPQRVLTAAHGADPAVSVWSLNGYEQQRNAGIASLRESDKPQAERDRDRELERLRGDLKDHSAVVLYREPAPPR